MAIKTVSLLSRELVLVLTNLLQKEIFELGLVLVVKLASDLVNNGHNDHHLDVLVADLSLVNQLLVYFIEIVHDLLIDGLHAFVVTNVAIDDFQVLAL